MGIDFGHAKLYTLLKEKNSLFLNQVEQVYTYANATLPKLNRVFANYTGHGIEHSINVMEYMYNLIPEPELLSELEIVGLIYVALLHDIGMVVNEDEIARIKNDDLTIVDKKYSLVLKKYNEDENTSLQECIRPIHGVRSKKHIKEQIEQSWFYLPNFTNISFKEEIEDICVAHNENFEWIVGNLSSDAIKGSYRLNSQFLAILLRIADYLDIDEERAPLYLYKYLNPKDYGDMEWRQHFVIENKEKIVLNTMTGYKHIEFYGSSENPNIHRKLLKYFDNINSELIKAVNLSETFPTKQYMLLLKTNIENKIRTRGFHFSDFKLTLDYNAVTNLLMGEHIYGNKKYGLRELIQNSIDACKVMQEEAEGKYEFLYNPYQPFINIILDTDRKQVSIFDNGRGMSLDILKKYFLNVGVSYYISDDYLLRGNTYTPIGNYGIGFLACFMLSNNVVVNTKYYGDSKLNKIEFEKNSEYICLTYEDNPRPQGTEIILDYNQFFTVFESVDKIQTFIELNFLECEIPINIIIMENGKSAMRKCKLQPVIGTDVNNIILSEYLNDIIGYVNVNYKSIQFLDKLQEINGYDSYIYKSETKELIEEIDGNIKDYVKDGQLSFLNIPIIGDQEVDSFNKAYEVLDSYDDALDKTSGYDMINIICNDIFLYNSDETIFDNEHKIIDEFCFSNFCETFSHNSDAPTHTYLVLQKVIKNHSKKILPYNEEQYIGNRYFDAGERIYIRNVFVSDIRLKIPYLVDGIHLKSAVFNITNKNFVPNVSRNNLSEKLKHDLSYAVGKALHLWILDHGDLLSEEKELLRSFIKECYPNDNYCLRND